MRKVKLFRSFLLAAALTVLAGGTCFAEELPTGEYEEGGSEETYTVTWLNANGDVLQQDHEVAYGEMPPFTNTESLSEGEIPGMISEFDHWDPEEGPVTCDTVYTAVYKRTPILYTVRWLDSDGSTVLSERNDVTYGEWPDPPEEVTVPEPDAENVYIFEGWYPTPSGITQDTDYTAIVTPYVRMYTIRYFNWDGTLLHEMQGNYRSWPDYGLKTLPERPSDDEYDYRFAGWTPEETEITEDADYVALYDAEKKTKDTLTEPEGKQEEKKVPEEKQEEKAAPEAGKKEETTPEEKTEPEEKTALKEKTEEEKRAAVSFGGSSSGGSSSGGGSASGGTASGSPAAGKTAAPAYSDNWYRGEDQNWYVKDSAGNTVKSAWVCDNKVPGNGDRVWYLIRPDGTMETAGLVMDASGNFYSIEMEHNGNYGMLRHVNGVYDGIYMEFSQDHNGTFGAILNSEAIEQLKKKFGVTKFGFGNEAVVYTGN